MKLVFSVYNYLSNGAQWSKLASIKLSNYRNRKKIQMEWHYIKTRSTFGLYYICFVFFCLKFRRSSVLLLIPFKWTNRKDYTMRDQRHGLWQAFTFGSEMSRPSTWHCLQEPHLIPITVWQYFSGTVRQSPWSHFKNISWPFHHDGYC